METLEETCSQFLKNQQEKGKTANSLENYKTDLDCFLDFCQRFFDSKKKEDLLEDEEKRGIPLAFLDYALMKEYGSCLESKYKDYPNSKRRKLSSLRIFFDYLILTQRASSNLAKIIPNPPKELRPLSPVSLEDLSLLVAHLMHRQKEETYGPNAPNAVKIKKSRLENLSNLICWRDLCLFSLNYYTAIKVSHLGKVRWEEIFWDKENNFASPRILVSYRKRSPISIPFPSTFAKILLVYYEKFSGFMGRPVSSLFFKANFASILGEGMSPRGIELTFQKYKESLGLKCFTPKALCQSAVLYWLQQGKSPELVKDWMGVAPDYDLTLYLEAIEDLTFAPLSFLPLESLCS